MPIHPPARPPGLGCCEANFFAKYRELLLILSLRCRIDEDDIDDQCAALRKKLEAEQSRNGSSNSARGLKSHQVHELAQAKIQESEKLRRALGISKDYEEGSHWRRQEERAAEREKVVKEKEKTRERERSVSRSRSRSRSVSRSVSRSRSRSSSQSRSR